MMNPQDIVAANLGKGGVTADGREDRAKVTVDAHTWIADTYGGRLVFEGRRLRHVVAPNGLKVYVNTRIESGAYEDKPGLRLQQGIPIPEDIVVAVKPVKSQPGQFAVLGWLRTAELAGAGGVLEWWRIRPEVVISGDKLHPAETLRATLSDPHTTQDGGA